GGCTRRPTCSGPTRPPRSNPSPAPPASPSRPPTTGSPTPPPATPPSASTGCSGSRIAECGLEGAGVASTRNPRSEIRNPQLEGPLVELRNVSVSYPGPDGAGRIPVASDLSVTLQKGGMAYLIGPTGSGKSTLLKLLYMDVKPDFGLVRVGHYASDRIADKEVPFLRRSLGVVFQDFQLLPDRSAFDNVAFALYATGKRGRAVKERVMQALARVGLSHRAHARPHELTGGEQQRACIARAI